MPVAPPYFDRWDITAVQAAPPGWQLVFLQADGRHKARPLYYFGFGVEYLDGQVSLGKTWDLCPLDYDPDGHYWEVATAFPGY